MNNQHYMGAALAAICIAAPISGAALADQNMFSNGPNRGDRIRHVLLISIDGMHALDFANCVSGVERRPALLPEPRGARLDRPDLHPGVDLQAVRLVSRPDRPSSPAARR